MRYFLTLVALLFVNLGYSQEILSQRERAELIDEILEERLVNLLPELMDNSQIDMWILISREYNEDPVLKTMLPSTWLNARRRTMIVFYRDKKNNKIEKLAIAPYDFGKQIKSSWDKNKQPNQWLRLVEVIEQYNPKKIGINTSQDFNIADGLDHTDYEELISYLPKRFESRLVSAQPLATSWIETRTDREMEIYTNLAEITHGIIAEAFSESVVVPGITTTSDLEWWMRDKVTELGLKTWFHPTVDIQRTKDQGGDHLYSFSDRPENNIIQAGDLLHCDFGITYLRLNTDCQELAYVLKPGENEAPQFLVDALEKGNRLQDILTSNFKLGQTGNEILLRSLDQAKREGLRPSIYTHPLGSYGHSSGPTIGMWDSQGGVSGTGDYPLYYNTVYAIELNTTVFLEEWNRDIRIMLEEAGFYGEKGFHYVGGRQKELLVIPRKKDHLRN